MRAFDPTDALAVQSSDTPPVTPVPATAPNSTSVDARGILTIAADEWLYFLDVDPIRHGAVGVWSTTGDPTPGLVNAGKITVAGRQNVGVMGISVTGSWPASATVSVTNAATGAIYAHATGDYGAATAAYLGDSVHVENAGLVQAVSDFARAIGMVFVGPGYLTNTASGVIKVWGEGNGLGVSFAAGGILNNAGLIDVYGGTTWLSSGVIGVWDAVFFNNSGVIRATRTNDIALSVAVLMDSGVSSFVNSGTIQGDYAFLSTVDSPVGAQTLNNSGRMIGAVDGGSLATTLINTGFINGPVLFGEQNDTYLGAGGARLGALYLGAGVNVATLGDHGETVVCEAGVNTVTGGAGDDLIIVTAGSNTIDGGGGFNAVSFEAAVSPVVVNLATGVVTGGSATTLSHVQAVLGSDFNDVLIGGGGDDILRGMDGDDVFLGSEGNDVMSGDGGQDWLPGGDGADGLTGGDGHDSVWGGAGDDLLDGGEGDDTIDGGAGIDTVVYAQAAAGVEIDLSVVEDQLTRGAGVDTLISIENVIGSAFDDRLIGGAGANALTGGAGADSLAGGAGADLFVYTTLSDSTVAARDVIVDFTRGLDRIDLSALDASSVMVGDQAFHLGATAGHEGDIVVAYDGLSNQTSVSLYVDGDAMADAMIMLTGNLASLTASDFIL